MSAARRRAARLGVALLAGLVFGLGLSLSGMLDPTRVRGFLDVTGAWDPSLAFVLGGAVGVSALGYRLVRQRPRPWLDAHFQIPANRRIDAPLILGSAVFGIGWGLSGFCPGPAVSALSTGATPVLTFVGAMLIGMGAHRALVGAGAASAATARDIRRSAGPARSTADPTANPPR